VTSVIEIKDYTWKYLHTTSPALNNINLSIEEGSFVGVIGPNGAGKTTLAYSIDGLIPGQYNGIKKENYSKWLVLCSLIRKPNLQR